MSSYLKIVSSQFLIHKLESGKDVLQWPDERNNNAGQAEQDYSVQTADKGLIVY